MIIKAKSIGHTQAALEYANQILKNPEIIFSKNLTGNETKDFINQFNLINQLNQRVKNNTIAVIISPTISDGRKMSKKDFEKVIDNYWNNMNFGDDRQGIAILHRDKKHIHAHLYVNRIDFHGKTYKDKFIGQKSMNLAKEIAQELGYTSFQEVKNEKLSNSRKIRAEIKLHFDSALKSKPKSNSELQKLLMARNVQLIESINKKGELRGFRIEYKNQDFKASEVHRSLSKNNILKILSENAKEQLITNENIVEASNSKTLGEFKPTENIIKKIGNIPLSNEQDQNENHKINRKKSKRKR